MATILAAGIRVAAALGRGVAAASCSAAERLRREAVTRLEDRGLGRRRGGGGSSMMRGSVSTASIFRQSARSSGGPLSPGAGPRDRIRPGRKALVFLSQVKTRGGLSQHAI